MRKNTKKTKKTTKTNKTNKNNKNNETKKLDELISETKIIKEARLLPSTFKKTLVNILDSKNTINLSSGTEFSEYGAYDDVLLIKFIKPEHIDSVMSGAIYFPLVSSFWKDSNNPDVDINEGKLVLNKNYNKDSIFTNGRNEYTLKDIEQTSYDILNAGNIPICCFAEATLESSNLKLIENTSSYDIYKFSESFIKDLIPIRDSRPFIICSYKDLVTKFYGGETSINSTEGGGLLTSGTITYLDYYAMGSNFGSNISLDELLINKYSILFRKDIEYKNQHECRFAFLLNNRKEVPITIKTKSLIDITNKYDSTFKLEDLKLIYDRKNKKFKVVIDGTGC